MDRPDDSGETLLAASDRSEHEDDGALVELLSGRYRLLHEIAHGGGGVVLRVEDSDFDRVVAMKVMHAEHATSELMRMRFVNEASITAQLQHPAIPAVHERGELRDGRLWYTMKEVRGCTLTEVIEQMHRGDARWPFRRVVDAFARLAQALGYAHQLGIVHRDVKPDNLMVGEFGEVMVMDWGLARRTNDSGEHGRALRGQRWSMHDALTQNGDVLGTPAYMSPEQARGEPAQHGPTSDVYSLGAVLYHLLAARPPFVGSARAVWRRLVSGKPPIPVDEIDESRNVPPELAEITAVALAQLTGERFPTATQLADQVLVWLDGARRRERALTTLRAGDGELEATRRLEQLAQDMDRTARDQLACVRPSDPIATKVGAWRLQDDAAVHRRDAAVHETNWLEAVHGALTLEPDLPEAHSRLASYYRGRLLSAERAGDIAEAARCETLLKSHDRGEHAAFISGDGRLTVLTEPSGAEVVMHRFVERDRQLVTQEIGSLGFTPLEGVRVMHGSYLLELRAADRPAVNLPVQIERGAHCDGVPPEARASMPIVLPAAGELRPGDVYVPAGWCWIGGDDSALDSLPAERRWVDGFIICRDPVTNAQYLDFINDLVDRGEVERAHSLRPRAPLGVAGGSRRFAFDQIAGGRYALGEEHDGLWQPHWPVVMISWHAAMAYAAWMTELTGVQWRLPHEFEREKAARGVDGRHCTWGNHLDPALTVTIESFPGALSRLDVDDERIDRSLYGIRGLCGHTRDWCLNRWQASGDDPAQTSLRIEGGSAGNAQDDAYQAVRGGAWASSLVHSRAACRFAMKPDQCRVTTGLRLVRSYPSGSLGAHSSGQINSVHSSDQSGEVTLLKE